MSNPRQSPEKNPHSNSNANLNSTPVKTPQKNKKTNQLDFPISYSPEEQEIKNVIDRSPNKAGTPLNHATKPNASPVNDKNSNRRVVSPVQLHSAGTLFKPITPGKQIHSLGFASYSQIASEPDHAAQGDAKRMQEEIARQLAYDEFLLIIQSTDSFKSYATFAALSTQIQLFDAVKQQLKNIPRSKTSDKLSALLGKTAKSFTDTRTKESKAFNDMLTVASPHLEKIKANNYAKPQAARALIPEVLKIMTNSQPIREALRDFYAARDAYDTQKHNEALALNPQAVKNVRDPAMLFADITIKGNMSRSIPEKHVCMLSLSGAEKIDANVKLLTVLREQLENQSFNILGKPYEIVIVSRFSDDFQSFILRVLNEINRAASAKFTQQVKAFYHSLENEEKKLFQTCATPYLQTKSATDEEEKENSPPNTEVKTCDENQFLQWIEQKACLKQHSGNAAFKTCAEKPFMAEYAKALILSAIKNPNTKEHLVLEGVECIELTFRREGVEKFRGGKSQADAKKQNKSSSASFELSPDIHNRYLKRPSDEIDPSQNALESYECEHRIPCSQGCAINRPGFLTFISSIAEHMAQHRYDRRENRVNVGLQHLTSPTRLSPSKVKNEPFQLETWLNKTPLTQRLKQMISEEFRGNKLDDAFEAAGENNSNESETEPRKALVF